MQLRYVGPAKHSYALTLPVPFLANSDRIGEVVFAESAGWSAEVPDEYVEYLLDEDKCGGVFEPVETGVDVDKAKSRTDRLEAKIEKALGKKFGGKTGKWDAKRYLKTQHLEEVMGLERNAYGHWILVRPGESPAASVTPISTDVEGQEGLDGSREVVSVGSDTEA